MRFTAGNLLFLAHDPPAIFPLRKEQCIDFFWKENITNDGQYNQV